MDEKENKEELYQKMFKNKTLLITGGTGSFGNAVLKRFLQTNIKEIRIFSRDEKKQDDMRHEYQSAFLEDSKKIKFHIGDVRDIQSIRNAIYGVDYIFHAAALKQVPSCEFFPVEAVKTNVLGTENVLTAAIEAGVEKVICLSTDKAAYPVNAMGTSKAMMEKVFVAKSRTVSAEKTLICGTRYGNVLCSRGSVVPLFIDQIMAGKELTVTEPEMTRFLMSLDEAVELVAFAFQKANTGDIMVQKAPASTIGVLAQAVSEIFDVKSHVHIIGIRHGEKMHETLLTNEECARATDLGDYYQVPADNRDLNYDNYFNKGNLKRADITEFTSANTVRLSVEQVKEKLLELSYVRERLKKWRERR
jgi:UDP-N-acetylglucosamine 4,6-dehydratase